jgi:hemolysin activation/secretion protein
MERTFTVLEYWVEGNTLLKTVDIERAVMPYLGENQTVKDVEAARARLEKAYHEHGYQTVLVNIPQQEVSSGIVRLTVIEAPVGRLEIKGSRYHSLEVIRSTVGQLQQGVVPDFTEVQKELTQVNRSQDLRVTPVLKASTTPGKVDVDLDVEDQLPLHGSLELNNRYSANTTHLRLIGQLNYDNLFQRNQSISFQYQIAPQKPSDAKIWSASYVIPTPGSWVFALYAVHSDSSVAAVGDLDVLGKGNIYGVRAIDALPSSASLYHNLTAGFDYKDFKENVAQGGTLVAATPARYPEFLIQYQATVLGAPDSGNQHARAAVLGARNSTTAEMGVSFVANGVYTNAEEFAAKRAGAGPSFFIAHLSLQRQQILPRNWSLDLRLDGQLANEPLISNEQYAVGGLDTVRGYTEAERLGDDGVHASLELRTPQLLTIPHSDRSYLYLFADGAHVSLIDALPGQEDSFRLASFGVGLRFRFYGLTVDVDGAHAMTSAYVTQAGDNSVQFRVNYAH